MSRSGNTPNGERPVSISSGTNTARQTNAVIERVNGLDPLCSTDWLAECPSVGTDTVHSAEAGRGREVAKEGPERVGSCATGHVCASRPAQPGGSEIGYLDNPVRAD